MGSFRTRLWASGITLLMALPVLTAPVHARERLGLGMAVGNPTGISTKFWLTNLQALSGGAAWSFRRESAFQVYGDYVLHHDLTQKLQQDPDVVRLKFYYGIGGRAIAGERDRLSVRIPAGFTEVFTRAPFDLYLEVVPLIDLAPETEFDLNVAFGARYYF